MKCRKDFMQNACSAASDPSSNAKSLKIFCGKWSCSGKWIYLLLVKTETYKSKMHSRGLIWEFEEYISNLETVIESCIQFKPIVSNYDVFGRTLTWHESKLQGNMYQMFAVGRALAVHRWYVVNIQLCSSLTHYIVASVLVRNFCVILNLNTIQWFRS